MLYWINFSNTPFPGNMKAAYRSPHKHWDTIDNINDSQSIEIQIRNQLQRFSQDESYMTLKLKSLRLQAPYCKNPLHYEIMQPDGG